MASHKTTLPKNGKETEWKEWKCWRGRAWRICSGKNTGPTCSEWEGGVSAEVEGSTGVDSIGKLKKVSIVQNLLKHWLILKELVKKKMVQKKIFISQWIWWWHTKKEMLLTDWGVLPEVWYWTNNWCHRQQWRINVSTEMERLKWGRVGDGKRGQYKVFSLYWLFSEERLIWNSCLEN